MAAALDTALLRKRLAVNKRSTSTKTIYGQETWVDDLDIINELGGHTGCVNALSWSRSGQFLASGSDDTYLNIWSYNPDSTARPFDLRTSVDTGHNANIFSTKFMPHSNDRTVVTCAGDSEVRVFDVERDGQSATSERRSGGARSARFHDFFRSATYLHEGNTNARIYRSHADRVKRIVTESSPHLFLTCSEDGEVRQWDLRQPSSAYPPPRGGQGFMSYRHAENHDATNVPPPLISYKNYSLDLNSISCSPRQPHYIALGGAHLHCFLHDRRMLGRNIADEQGRPPSSTPPFGSTDDESMGQATRCVKRFAPHGKQQMAVDNNGHITACKISDANPNEMIVSWSGDHIYSFDLVQSADAREAEAARLNEYKESRNDRIRRSRNHRKRKRQATSLSSLREPARARMAITGQGEDDDGEFSLRVRYGNGQSENISITPTGGRTAGEAVERARGSLLSESQKLSDRVAKALVKLRKTLFEFRETVEDSTNSANSTQLTPHTKSFTSTLGFAATLLPHMEEIIRLWRFPMNPTRSEVVFQQTLRRNRQASRRFVQAAGTLARVLGGRLQTMDPENDPRMAEFQKIVPAPLERDEIERPAQFAYDFLKAILLWLASGRFGLVEGFKAEPVQSRHRKRFPLDATDGDEAIETKLIPYLSNLAAPTPIVNIDISRFEVDENRNVFDTQSSAVMSFARAVGGYDLGWSPEPSVGLNGPRQSLDRAAASRFWGVKVGRSLLMTAGEGVNYEFVNRAFGGIDVNIQDDDTAEDPMDIERVQEDMDPNDSESEIETVEVQRTQPAVEDADDSIPEIRVQDADGSQQHHDSSISDSQITGVDMTDGSTRSDIDVTTASSMAEADTEAGNSQSDEDEDEDMDDEDDNESDLDGDFASDSDDDDSSDRIVFRSAVGFGRSRQRARVEGDKPCSSHTRVYRGHCNVRTVKDVNFYGLNDEYVISGSDDGNFFIWDRKTARLLNVLEGDGETVNVVQGHPYEPMIAVSGIDSTIKIFSPDARLQQEARKGQGIATPMSGNPLISHHSLIPPTSESRRSSWDNPGQGLSSRRRVDQMYSIISRNDTDRQGGVGDAYLTRSMLARLAGAINRGQAGGLGQGGQIVIDDSCRVM